MSVAIPKASAVFGSVTPPQSDIIDLRVHLGCTTEISSFECLLQNFDKKYSPGGTYPINVGDVATISLGRDPNCPSLLTGKVEEIEPLSAATENYIRVRGRCWGEHLFRRLVTKSYDNVKGEAVVKDIIDSYTSLSHVRTNSLLTSNAASGQKVCNVANGALFNAGMLVKIQDNNASEYNEVASVLANAVTMVNNLANTYTVTAAGKVWIDLIEKTDTTYTRLDYEDTPIFDVKKYIAETADKTGVIGYDFRIAPDGKFEFFPKNSKTSSVSLSERLEVSEYSKNIHRIKNKITIYGAPERPEPADRDQWTEPTQDPPENWVAVSSDTTITRSTVSPGPKVGTYYVRANKGTIGTLDFYRSISNISLLKGVVLKVWVIYGQILTDLKIRLRAPDASNYFETTLTLQKENVWYFYELATGRSAEYNAVSNPNGVWTKVGSASWNSIQGIEFLASRPAAPIPLGVDGMFFDKFRWKAIREDSGSQTQYGLREKVETDEELHSDAECDYRAKALIDFLKGPIETLKVRSEVVDYGTTPILAADKVHVIIPNENIDSDYRIISVEYKASGRDQTLDAELELAKEPQLLADFIYGFRKSIQKLDKYKASAVGEGVIISSGVGGGGGLSQHGNEYHDPDMALQSDFASHKDRHKSGGADAFVLADLLDCLARVDVKEAGVSKGKRRGINFVSGATIIDDAANEEVDVTIAGGGGGNVPEPIAEDILGGWKRIFQLPFANQYGLTKLGQVLGWGAAGKFDDAGIAHPCVVKVGDYYYLFYSGWDGAKHAIGVARATSPSGPYTRLNNGDPILVHATNHYCIPSVMYDHYETDANKKWKMYLQYRVGTAIAIYYSYSANPDSGWITPVGAGVVGPPTGYERLWGHSGLRIGTLFYFVSAFYRSTDGDCYLNLCVATSPDMSHTDLGNILSKGASGAWDGYQIRYVTAIYILGTFYIFYSGQETSSGTTLKIGMATSPYGGLFSGVASFYKFARNPLLQEQPTTFCYAPSLLIVDDTFYMWYASGADDIRLAKIP